MIPTIKIDIKQLAYVAEKAIASFKKGADKMWNKEVDEFYNINKDKRYFWVGKLKWETREDVEKYLGKHMEDPYFKASSVYGRCYGSSRQSIMYKHFIKAHLSSNNRKITLSLYDYNLLMNFKDV